MTQNLEDDRPFDHDAYVRSRLPDFVLAGMGLKAASTPVRPATPAPQVVAPAPVNPSTSGNTHTPGPQPAVKPTQRSITKPVSTRPEPPARPTKEPEPDPVRRREDATSRLARQTVTAVLAIPVWLIVILLIFGVLHGAPEPSETVVNDRVTCESPETVPVANLGTDPYWERC